MAVGGTGWSEQGAGRPPERFDAPHDQTWLNSQSSELNAARAAARGGQAQAAVAAFRRVAAAVETGCCAAALNTLMLGLGSVVRICRRSQRDSFEFQCASNVGLLKERLHPLTLYPKPMTCSKLEGEGAVQDPWARLAHAQALAAAGDAAAADAVLAAGLKSFHIADKSEVRHTSSQVASGSSKNVPP